MATDDFFRARLDSMIDMRHPLVVLATRTPHQNQDSPADAIRLNPRRIKTASSPSNSDGS
jgi:hypothetical protein